MKKLDPPKKKRIWILAALVLAAAVGIGGYFALSAGGDPVPVYPFAMVGMTEFWGDTQESYGPVTTDRIQTIYLSETQTITEVKVALGDNVKKGDVLVTFDTTMSDLKLEKQRLSVEKLKLQIEEAKKELKRIQHLEPMEEVTIPPPDPGATDPGKPLKGMFKLYFTKGHTGATQEEAVICWIAGDQIINLPSLLEEVRQSITNYLYPKDEDASKDKKTGTQDPGDSPDQTTPPDEPQVEKYYVVFKITERDREKTSALTWQGVTVTGKGTDFTLRFFTPSFGDYTKEEKPQDVYVPDMGSGYTAKEILQMAVEQAKVIQDLDFQLKMAEAEYKIMLKELGDGNIYAEFNGEVVSLLTEEEAKDGKQPLVKLSGGGGFHIEGTVSELVMDELSMGQEVTINDWNTGSTYTGTIQSIGDFPETGNGWNGMGNPNASYFPFRVFVDGEADLQAGTYVSIQYSAGEATSGVYLENPFLRSGQGPSYVYVRNAQGRLEKRTVTTGKSLWGSYTEILSGLSAEDYVAFPYGKEIREGAATTEGDLASLYGY